MCLLGLPGARALDKSPTRVIAPPIIPGPAVAQPRNHTPHRYARSRSDREPYPPSICSPFGSAGRPAKAPAQASVRDRYLGGVHLMRYARLLGTLIAEG